KEAMAEHRVYEAAPGALLVAATLLVRLGRARVALVACLVAGLAAATVARLWVWSSPIRLWSEAARYAPDAWGPRYALGDALRDSGDCAAAAASYRDAIALAPEESRPYVNLGLCLITVGNPDLAEFAFRAALAHRPGDAVAHADLGALLL